MHGVSDKLKEIWTMDKRQKLESFQRDQARNGMNLYLHTSIPLNFLPLVTGKRSNQWSMITIRMGKITVFII